MEDYTTYNISEIWPKPHYWLHLPVVAGVGEMGGAFQAFPQYEEPYHPLQVVPELLKSALGISYDIWWEHGPT